MGPLATAIAGWETGDACIVGTYLERRCPCGTGPHGRRLVEGAVLEEERAVGEEAVPGLADEGGADEARWVFGRKAEEDLADEVVRQLRQ